MNPLPRSVTLDQFRCLAEGLVGVREPMHEDEEPVVRPYWLVDDIEAAVEAATAGELLVLQHYSLLGRKISMREVYAHRLAFPTGRGTSEVIGDIARPIAPISHLTVDYEDILNDIEVRNGFLVIMVFGQALWPR
ncbi:MAG: hypothetical protein HOI35_14430 [Woeseia sp.]|nr:hypothetical protein [Woeseia sp.]